MGGRTAIFDKIFTGRLGMPFRARQYGFRTGMRRLKMNR